MKPLSLGNFPAVLPRNYQQAISLAMVTREFILLVPGQVSHQVQQQVNSHAVTESCSQEKEKDVVAPISLLLLCPVLLFTSFISPVLSLYHFKLQT